MSPEQRLEQAVRFAEMLSRQTGPVLTLWLTQWSDTKQFAPDDEQAIRSYVARLMCGESPDMIVTSLEQTGEAA